MSLVLADLLVGLGREKGLEVGRVRELDLAEPACRNKVDDREQDGVN